MRPSRDLGKLRRRAVTLLGRLRAEAIPVVTDFSPHSRKIIGQVTIDLLNAWANFSRSYYLSCVLRPKRERGGRVIATAFSGSGFTDAITVAMGRHRPKRQQLPGGGWSRRDEPPWHHTAVLLTSCADLGCSNLGQIQASVSTGTAVFNHLPTFRHFFAHRNDFTVSSARSVAASYSIPSAGQHPSEILRSPPYGRPSPLLLEWIDDLQVTIELMCV